MFAVTPCMVPLLMVAREIDPFDPVNTVMLPPATMYEDPSTRRVKDPLSPALCFVTPVKVVPLTVATILSFIERVKAPLAPPSKDRIPLPAVSDLSLVRVESLPTVRYAEELRAVFGDDMFIEPLDPEDI